MVSEKFVNSGVPFFILSSPTLYKIITAVFYFADDSDKDKNAYIYIVWKMRLSNKEINCLQNIIIKIIVTSVQKVATNGMKAYKICHK